MYNLTPILTTTPGEPLSYNPGMAETFSWVPVQNTAGRPLFAQASYITNAEDIKVQLSASNININLDDLKIDADTIVAEISATNTLINCLTAINQTEFDQMQTLLASLTSIETTKHDLAISLLSSLTAINQTEFDQTQTLLSSLTGIESSKLSQIITTLGSLTGIDQTGFGQTQTLLASLTSIQTDKQDQIISLLGTISLSAGGSGGSSASTDALLNSLTAIAQTEFDQTQTLLVGISAVASDKLTKTNTLLSSLTASNVRVPGFDVPPYDEINITYVGSTEYFEQVKYVNNSTQVMALSFVYMTNPPSVADNRIQKIKKI
jgi:DNA-binding transcriptional regulator/RsmH inhibitor MraZ